MKISNILLWVVVASLGGWLWLASTQSVKGPSIGSVTAGNDYRSWTTPTTNNATDVYLRPGQGTLGSVIVTGQGTQEFYLLNSTTSLANTILATSSILLGVIPANTPAGTYTFDTYYTKGLFLDVITSGTGTTTVTYRQ